MASCLDTPSHQVILLGARWINSKGSEQGGERGEVILDLLPPNRVSNFCQCLVIGHAECKQCIHGIHDRHLLGFPALVP